MMDSAEHPRGAEMAAGLIQASLGNLKDEAHAYGYQNVLNMIASYRGRAKVDFHFTCLEKDDREWDGSSRAFWLAKTLVFWVARGAANKGVVIKGENALDGGVMSDRSVRGRSAIPAERRRAIQYQDHRLRSLSG